MVPMPSIGRHLLHVALACGIALPAAAGCHATPCDTPAEACASGLVDAGSGAGWRESRSFPLPQGVILEAQIGMSQGDSIEVDYTSTGGGPVVWDIHTHNDDQVPIHAQGRDTQGSFRFVAPADGVYDSRWTNDGLATLRVDVAFRGSGSSVSFTAPWT